MMSRCTALTIRMRAVVVKDPLRGQEGTGGDRRGHWGTKITGGGTSNFQLTHELFIMVTSDLVPVRTSRRFVTSAPVAMNRELHGPSVTVLGLNRTSK